MTLENESPLPPSHDTSHDSMDQSHDSMNQSRDSQVDTEACHVTRSSKSSVGNDASPVCEQKSTPFQIADSEFVVEDQVQSASPVTAIDDVKKDNKNDKYLSPLIRHQRNRGYESSDDDDVFLPDPILRKAMVSKDTKDALPNTEKDKPVARKESIPVVPPVPPLIAGPEEKASGSVAVVIKRGRGTAKTLDLQKLQLPLSQG